MNESSRLLGIAPLSVLGTTPARFIEAAARAGYDFVGLRTRPVTATEPDLNLIDDHHRRRETLAALRDTGMKLVDTEFVLLDGQFQREQWLPMLEAAAELGGKTLTFAAADTNRPRLLETVAAMVADGEKFGIQPTLEPISYQAVRQLQEGVEIARQTGCQVLLDTLHFYRAGCEVAQIEAAKPYLAGMVQLCDGPVDNPPVSREALVEESRSRRDVPGEGGFPLVDYIRHLPPQMAVSVEVPNPQFGELGLDAYLLKLMQAARAVLAKAEA